MLRSGRCRLPCVIGAGVASLGAVVVVLVERTLSVEARNIVCALVTAVVLVSESVHTGSCRWHQVFGNCDSRP